MGDDHYGVSPGTLHRLAVEIAEVRADDVEIAIVIGGGNIFRGMKGAAEGMDRTAADYMGMLATVINALALQDAFERAGVPTRVMSGISMPQVAEPFIHRRAVRHMEKGRVVIFGAGTGNPYFTTDTAAALRASEINADVLLKATKVDGVYDADPAVHADAKRFDRVSFDECLSRRLNVMDATAFSLCRENEMPVVVFDLGVPRNILRVVRGEPVGTRVDARGLGVA